MKKINYQFRLICFLFFSLFYLQNSNAQCLTSSAPINICTIGDQINAFSLNGIPAVGNSGCGANGYNSFASPVFTLTAGNSYPYTATVGNGLSLQGVGIWIDLNNNGQYEASEFVGSTLPAVNHSGTIVIPCNATVASGVRMRVRCAFANAVTSGEACTNFIGAGGGFGETEDYFVNILAPVLPTVTASSTPSPATVCAGGSVTLTGGGASTYTWSNGVNTPGNGVSFVPVSTSTYTVTGTTLAGCANTATIVVTVNAGPASPVITATPTAICPGGNSDLNAVSTGNTIKWYDALTLGTLLTTVPSATNYNVAPGSTTTYYAEAVAPVGGTQTFNYTGSTQTFTVPAGVTSIQIESWGAQGNSNAQGVVGGLGGYATGTLAVTPGDILYLEVGGGGTISTIGGYNGGGAAGAVGAPGAFGGGGGGCSDVRLNVNSLATRVIVAAGGGGAGGNRIATLGRGTGGGGGGGYYGGGGGAAWPSASLVVPTGGNQISGGIGGTSTYASAPNNNGLPGVLGIGGKGGDEVTSNQAGSQTASSGGVGGGLSGANGTYAGNFSGQSGAGGSSYITGLSAASTTSGIRSGNGQIILTWTGSGCASNPRTPVTVTVNPIPTVTASSTPSPATVCAGSSVTLTGGGATTYTWTDGLNTPTDGVSFVPTSSSTYTVTGTTAGCSSTATLAVTVNPNPTVTASSTPSPATVCAGNSVTLTGGGATTYTWSDGVNTAIDGVSFIPASSSTYTVTGTSAGCSSTATLAVTVNPLPTVTATATPNDTVCLGSSVTLQGGGANSYTWSNGVNTPTNGVAFTSIVSGTTTYTVTGTDGNGCIGTSTVDLTVNALPIVTANALPNDTICANELLTLFGGGASTYLWTGGVNDNIPFLLATPTTYTVTGTDGNGCSNTESIAIHTYPAPLPITINSTPIVPEVCGTNPIVLTATGGVNYSWSNGISNGVLFYPPTTNNYTVVSTDANGCTISSTVLVTVNTTTGNLALAVGANVASISGSSTTNYDQLENSHVKYYNAACNLICEVETGIGINFGNVISQVLVSSAVLNYNGQPYVRRRFIISPTNNGPAVNIILPVLQADFNTYNLSSPTWPQLPTGPTDLIGIGNIRISKISGGPLGIGTATVITPTVNWNGNYWELSFPVGGLSEFYVHSVNPGNVPLPATITQFEGQIINMSNHLTWTTSNEQNNAFFNLQYSTNGIDFKNLAYINTKASNGSSSVDLNYHYEHTKPQLGHNYYRLQQLDIDNQSSINAKVVDIIWGTNGSTLSIYPNPTQDVLNIDLYTSKVQNTTVKVLDMSGRIVKQIQGRSEAGMNKISISLGEIASGVYTVQVFENDNLTHVSKVKKND